MTPDQVAVASLRWSQVFMPYSASGFSTCAKSSVAEQPPALHQLSIGGLEPARQAFMQQARDMANTASRRSLTV